jgi:hypothetical protein
MSQLGPNSALRRCRPHVRFSLISSQIAEIVTGRRRAIYRPCFLAWGELSDKEWWQQWPQRLKRMLLNVDFGEEFA